MVSVLYREERDVKKTAIAALLVAVSGGALADDVSPYVTASLGNATLDDTFGIVDVDEDSSAYRIGVGIDFTQTFGLEAGYHRFGTFEEDTPERFRLDADGWYLGANVGAPLAPNFRLIGRGGLFFYDGDSIFDEFIRESQDDGYFYWGGGAEVELANNFSLVGDWTRYELEDTESDVISIGFRLRFN